MTTLKPCPFCGGEADLICEDGGYWVICQSCGAKGLTHYISLYPLSAKKHAVNAWNRRAQPENEPLTLDELRQMDGEPVYIVDEDLWGIIKCDLVGRWAGMPFAVGHYSGVNFEWDIKKRGLVCCRSKPKEEHHETD